MKKFMNLISWCSVFFIIAFVVTLSELAGIYAINIIGDVLNLEGCWNLLLSIPFLAVGFLVSMFFLIGIRKLTD